MRDGGPDILDTARPQAQSVAAVGGLSHPQRSGGSLRMPAWLGRLIGPDRRFEARLPIVSGAVRIGESVVRVDDIGSGGMKLAGYRGLLQAQDRFDFKLHLVDVAETLEIDGTAVVAWRCNDRLGVAFYSLQPADRDRLHMFLESVKSGVAR